MARAIAIIVARIIFSFVFFMAAGFKFADIGATAGYITAAGFPMATFLTWIAAFFEIALALAFISGAFFTEASLLAAIYVIFLAFAFHGPSHWNRTRPSSASSSITLPSSPVCSLPPSTDRERWLRPEQTLLKRQNRATTRRLRNQLPCRTLACRQNGKEIRPWS